MRNRLTLVLLLCLIPQTVPAQDKPSLSQIDRVRLAEAFRLGETLGNRIWKGWDQAPFAVLLVAPEYEFLIRHDQPSEDFKLVGYDSLLKSNVYYRKRTQPPNLLATFSRGRRSFYDCHRPGGKHFEKNLHSMGYYLAARTLPPITTIPANLLSRGECFESLAPGSEWHVDVELPLSICLA